MRKKLLTLTIIAGSLLLGACAEDSTMDELIDDVELNDTTEPDEDDDTNPPAGGGVNGG